MSFPKGFKAREEAAMLRNQNRLANADVRAQRATVLAAIDASAEAGAVEEKRVEIKSDPLGPINYDPATNAAGVVSEAEVDAAAEVDADAEVEADAEAPKRGRKKAE